MADLMVVSPMDHGLHAVHNKQSVSEHHLISEKYNQSAIKTAQVIRKDDDKWSINSWRRKPLVQGVEYPDPSQLEAVCEQLKKLPPLIPQSDIEQALEHVQAVADGNAFIIQGGDCAESFTALQYKSINGQLSLLARQQHILQRALCKPVIQIGRIAGQYAKPRSKLLETLPSGEVVHAFRGHNINSQSLSRAERIPDPQRLLLGYLYAATSLNTIQQIQQIPVLSDASQAEQTLSHTRAPFYTSHEALHLPYESALTHDSYNLSAAFLWVGERTRQLDGAHIEYVRGLRNPIGVKIGPGTTPETVVALLDRLTSINRQRVFLITRFGQGNASLFLHKIIDAVQASGHKPAWICDPCHGNTFSSGDKNIKTRRLDALLAEIKEVYLIHRQHGSRLGGLHLEQSGCNVTECLDQIYVTTSNDLETNYQSLCDPRLNANQAALLIEQFAQFVTELNVQESRGSLDTSQVVSLR